MAERRRGIYHYVLAGMRILYLCVRRLHTIAPVLMAQAPTLSHATGQRSKQRFMHGIQEDVVTRPAVSFQFSLEYSLPEASEG